MCHNLTTFEITRRDWSPVNLPFKGFSCQPWNVIQNKLYHTSYLITVWSGAHPVITSGSAAATALFIKKVRVKTCWIKGPEATTKWVNFGLYLGIWGIRFQCAALALTALLDRIQGHFRVLWETIKVDQAYRECKHSSPWLFSCDILVREISLLLHQPNFGDQKLQLCSRRSFISLLSLFKVKKIHVMCEGCALRFVFTYLYFSPCHHHTWFHLMIIHSCL